MQGVCEGGLNVRAPAVGAEDHFPAAAQGDDEGGRLVVERVGVRVRAHGLGVLGVEAGLADVRVVVFPSTAVLRLVA